MLIITTDWSLSHKWATVLCDGPWISFSPPALSAPSLVLATIWHWTSHWEEGECRGGNWSFAEDQSWTWARSQAKLRGHQPSPAQPSLPSPSEVPCPGPQLPFHLTTAHPCFHNRLGLPHLTPHPLRCLLPVDLVNFGKALKFIPKQSPRQVQT